MLFTLLPTLIPHLCPPSFHTHMHPIAWGFDEFPPVGLLGRWQAGHEEGLGMGAGGPPAGGG